MLRAGLERRKFGNQRQAEESTPKLEYESPFRRKTFQLVQRFIDSAYDGLVEIGQKRLKTTGFPAGADTALSGVRQSLNICVSVGITQPSKDFFSL